VISPFNFPFFLSMKSVAPALATGNGVVVKPHEQTPITGGTLLASIVEETGLPAGLLNVTVTEIPVIGTSSWSTPFRGSSRSPPRPRLDAMSARWRPGT
jgi:acyl-CoA reductase-like NAD-dependent aldehyde dehydrogenase